MRDSLIEKGLPMFSMNEKVVYPGHGVAQVNRIVEKIIGGKSTTLFELKFLSKDMTILVPTDNARAIGIRKLSSEKSIDDIFLVLSQPVQWAGYHELNATSWSKRSKQYQFKIRSGDIVEISKIYRDLQHIGHRKELSFGERSLLQQTETLLAQEISMVKNLVEETAIQRLRSLFLLSQNNLNTKAAGARTHI